MKKFVCTVCGYVYEGEAAPEKCPVCGAPASKFKEQSGEMTWAAEHVVGVAQGVSEDILEDLRANYEGECREVGMYLAMARVAHREGYPAESIPPDPEEGQRRSGGGNAHGLLPVPEGQRGYYTPNLGGTTKHCALVPKHRDGSVFLRFFRGKAARSEKIPYYLSEKEHDYG